MNCEHCGYPIDRAAMRNALNADAAKRKRPGALGKVRNPYGKNGRTSAELSKAHNANGGGK